MPLVYIEYISRRPGVSLEDFHQLAGGGQSGWAADHGDDVAVLNVGRSWRMGPEPEYLCAWYTADAGLERIDDWERVFLSGEADRFEGPFRIAARIDRSGCYTPLRDPVVGSEGRYYAEWFEPAPGAADAAVLEAYEERVGRHPELELNLLALRIGALGPDPRGLAVWGVPSWGAVEGICRDLDGVEHPLRLVTASLYADWGQEQL